MKQFEVLFGAAMLAAWAAVVFWGLGQATLSAKSGRLWEQGYLIGFVEGCAIGVGLVLMFGRALLQFDVFGKGFVLACAGAFAIWAHGRWSRDERRTDDKFKPDDELQTKAIGTLKEMIRRNLLTVCVDITDPSAVLSCPVREAIAAGSRSVTEKEIIQELLTGKTIKKKGGPGIELFIAGKFRLPSDE
jgi:hypothetical protein